MTIIPFGCQICGKPHTVTRSLNHYRLCDECDQQIKEQIQSLVKDNPTQHVFRFDMMYYFLVALKNYDSAECMVDRRVIANQAYIFDFTTYLNWCDDHNQEDA